jgi:hypothetical protein
MRSEREIMVEMSNPGTSAERRSELRRELRQLRIQRRETRANANPELSVRVFPRRPESPALRAPSSNAFPSSSRMAMPNSIFLSSVPSTPSSRAEEENQMFRPVSRRVATSTPTPTSTAEGTFLSFTPSAVQLPRINTNSNDNRLPREYVDLSASTESLSSSEEDLTSEEDSEEYSALSVNNNSLGDEYIKTGHDGNCKDKDDWIKMHCTSCQSPITLEEFSEESISDVISFKLYNEGTKKFGKGQCILRSELKEMLKSGDSNLFSIWKGGDTSGRGGKPTEKVVVKIYTGAATIYVTLDSVYKIFHNQKKEKVYYALQMYGGKRRRIGNLQGRIGMSENHGQIPGFQVYKLLTKSEIEGKAKGVEEKRDYNLDFLACGKMGELMAMFMDTTLVREYLTKQIINYIVGEK